MRRIALGVTSLVVVSLAVPGSWIATRAQTQTAPTPAAQAPAGAARPGATATPIGQPPANAPAKPPTGIVRGRVSAALGGRAIRGARVNLISAQPVIPGGVTVGARENRTIATDAEGRFEIKEVPAGRYRISAVKTGYVRFEYGQRAWNEPGTQIELVDGQTVERIDFALQGGGVIVVNATNPRGEPLPGAQVQAMQWRFVNGRRVLTPAMGTETNDLGQARVYGLSPGEYYVSLSPAFSTVGAATAKTAYVPTYYPGTLTAAEAQRVSVAIAQETNISLALVSAKTAAISGRVTKSDGSPLAYTPQTGFSPNDPVLSLQLRQEAPGGGFSQRNVPTKPDGSFNVPNLLPGDYTMQVRPTGNLAAFNGTAEFASVPVIVSGEDVSNLSIVSQRGAKITGKIIFDTGTPPADKTPEDLRVFVYSNMSETPLSAGLTTMHPDYSFEIAGVAMTGMVRLAVATTGWSVKEEIVEGKDIVEAPIAWEPGHEYKDIRLLFTQKRAELSGSATDGAGRPVKDFVALLFPQDRDRWFPRSLSIFVARSDQNGQFKISRIAGDKYGAYNVIALSSLEPGAEMDFELLARLAPNAVKINIGETEAKNITLKVQEVR